LTSPDRQLHPIADWIAAERLILPDGCAAIPVPLNDKLMAKPASDAPSAKPPAPANSSIDLMHKCLQMSSFKPIVESARADTAKDQQPANFHILSKISKTAIDTQRNSWHSYPHVALRAQKTHINPSHTTPLTRDAALRRDNGLKRVFC
jgi:hypothetical protein